MRERERERERERRECCVCVYDFTTCRIQGTKYELIFFFSVLYAS